jgi:hypothetical protein
MRDSLHRTWVPGLLLWGLLLVTAAIYWPGLNGPLVLDDFENLEPFAGIQSGALGWDEVLSANAIGLGGRPIAMISFAGNWLSSGGEVWSLKHTNLMLHLLCGTLLFWLAGRLLGEPRSAVAAQRWWLALLVAALWLLSPMLVSTVLYIIQRMAQRRRPRSRRALLRGRAGAAGAHRGFTLSRLRRRRAQRATGVSARRDAGNRAHAGRHHPAA